MKQQIKRKTRTKFFMQIQGKKRILFTCQQCKFCFCVGLNRQIKCKNWTKFLLRLTKFTCHQCNGYRVIYYIYSHANQCTHHVFFFFCTSPNRQTELSCKCCQCKKCCALVRTDKSHTKSVTHKISAINILIRIYGCCNYIHMT